MSLKLLSIIIPVYNEINTIEKIIKKVDEVESNDYKKQVIIVDDFSNDGTREFLIDLKRLRSDYTIIFQNKNIGKGKAIRTGLKHVKGEYTIIQDADLEYDPNEINLLIDPILKGVANVVYSSRFIGGKPHRVLYFWHSIANKYLTYLSNLFTGLNLTDMESGYKLFDTKLLNSLDLKENGFGFEPEVTAKICKIPDLRLYEVGISYYGRTYHEGKKISLIDAFKALFCIIKYNLSIF